MKTALGMMVRNFSSTEPIVTFLKNAEKYGHQIDMVIIVSSGEFKREAASEIERQAAVPVKLTKINSADAERKEFAEHGISAKTTEKLLYCSMQSNTGLVPYGFNRNMVLIQAILEKMDVLFYIDDDVAPYVLQNVDGRLTEKEVDFFGAHLAAIRKGADVTTSDYSGYNILPYAYFDGMQELLTGLQKDRMLEFWRHARMHKCLFLQHDEKPVAVHTKKVIGGNMAVSLRDKNKILPFFSPVYSLDGETFLARGEDTLITSLGEKKGLQCVDVDMMIFHNTYGDYPEIPSLKNKQSTQERFFFACTGWIGRNPFWNFIEGTALESVRTRQQANLIIGTKGLVGYTGNNRFSLLPRAYEAAWNSLPQMIVDYKETMDAWEEFISKVM